MKRIPLAIVLGVLCFAALSIFSQHRAAANRALSQPTRRQDQQTGQPSSEVRSEKSIVNEDGTISIEQEGKADVVEFVPGEVLVKFKNEKDANEVALGSRTAEVR